MKIKVVLFDLDGTLLPMEQDEFVKAYFGLLAKKLTPRGYEPKQLIDGIWAGTAAMVKNDGSKRNEDAFWDAFTGRCGEQAKADLPQFEEFYRTDFQQVQAVCGFNPDVKNAIAKIRTMGFRIALATNPIFPAIATESRIRWAGLTLEDFEIYTTYENSSFSKPNPAYYQAITEQLGVVPEECLMVGNDVTEDMVAQTLGMKVFLLTDCLINKKGVDITQYPHGDLTQMLAYVETLCEQN